MGLTQDETLGMIRANVDSLILNSSLSRDRKGHKVLDIAPQIYKGASAVYKNADVYTLDIDPSAGTDFIADITNCWLDSESWDTVLCTEVLEHTYEPWKAISEIYRLLKIDGKLYGSTPFWFRVHGPSPDCYRFTSEGLKFLLKDFRLVKITPMIENECCFLQPYQYLFEATK